MKGEKYFFGDATTQVSVSASRLVFLSRSWAVRHIVSVRTETRYSRLFKFPGWIFAISLFIFAMVPSQHHVGWEAVGLYTTIGLSGFWLLKILSRPYHRLLITTSNGHTNLLVEDKDAELIRVLRMAIEDAMSFLKRA